MTATILKFPAPQPGARGHRYPEATRNLSRWAASPDHDRLSREAGRVVLILYVAVTVALLAVGVGHFLKVFQW